MHHSDNFGGASGTRTHDPLHAMQVLYQLSYNPATDEIIAQNHHRVKAVYKEEISGSRRF